ncbi:alpha/beta fold hydrolase [Halomarina rubra]|uniref:Alpha/beta fold hydrolase n=1 Tax=Halomarina rubra TaxID=2071873 RepID=A0ABD6ATC9_9EURY|nr:alpha/beta hydrolase [Halomarina rubra]
METVTSADGTTIAYERTGRGPPLVLVHGSAGDHTRWELFGVRERLAEEHTVYAVDRRGRGESGDAPEYAIEREFEDVAAVVDAIDEPAAVLGHSYGATCAMEAALRTDAVDRLVLYEPDLVVDDLLDDLESRGVLADLKTRLDAGDDEGALVRFLADVAELDPAEVDALRAAPNWPDRVAAAHTLYRETVAPREYTFDPTRFESLTTPTLLLTGSESPAYLRASTDLARDSLPNCRVVVFEGHGHVAMNTAPERFVEAVLTFCRE